MMRGETHAAVLSPDVTINVEIYPGKGDTVVMLPGASLGAAALGEVPARVASAGYRVIAVNTRGAAGSTGPVDNITLHDLAADVAGVIEQLVEGPAHVLGHAGGNRVARCLAADRPALVKTVLLLAAGGLVPPDQENAAMFRRLWLNESLPDDERKALQAAVFLAPGSDPGVLDCWIAWPDTRKAFGTAVSATPLDDWWHGGTVPMLVVQGLDDHNAPPGNGRALLADYPDRVRLVELANAGHALHLEQPAAVTDAVLTWLADHP